VVIGTSFPFTNAFQPFIDSSVRNNVVAVVQFSVAVSSLELVTLQDDGVEKNDLGWGSS
jgi:hypothetical protein